jgi:cystathionine beta-lyase
MPAWRTITLADVSELSIPSIQELRKRSSEKWRRFPSDVLPLPVAEMDYEVAPAIKSRLIDLIERSDTGYLGPIPELGLAFKEFSQSRWGWSIAADRVRVASDVGVAVVELARLFVKTGEKVMVNSPVYSSFFSWIKELRCELVDVPMVESESEGQRRHHLNLQGIEEGYRDGVKVHFLSHPHNPLGLIYETQELAILAELAERYGVIVISDEIHAPLVYPGEEYTPFLNVSAIAAKVGICVISASKAFNLAGLKCAQIIVADESLHAKLKSLPEALHARASLFGAAAAVVAFQSCAEWLDAVRSDLQRKSRFLADLIRKELPDAYFFTPRFGYLGWIDMNSYQLGENPAKVFLDRGRVALVSGALYGPAGNGFVRFNFGTSDELINEGIARMKRAL